MGKKFLFLAPAAALGLGAILGGAGIAQASTAHITDNEASWRNCISTMDPAEDICTLELSDNLTLTEGAVGISSGGQVNIDLNGKELTINAPFNITHGELNISGNGSVLAETLSGSNNMFQISGSSDSTAEGYSKLSIGEGVTVSESYKGEAVVRIDTNSNRYGSTVDIDGTINTAANYGVYINGPDDFKEHTPFVNVNEGASIEAATNAIRSTAHATYNIKQASLQSGKDVIYAESGDFNIEKGNLETAAEEGKEFTGAIFHIGETNENPATGANQISLKIDGGTYNSDDAFYREDISPDFRTGSHYTIGEVAISDGTFTALNNLFDITTAFFTNHAGFITGGTWGHKWDEINDNDFVARGYLKDFDESLGKDSNVMTVTKPSVEDLPDGYSIELSRRVVNDAEFLKSLLEKAGIKGLALNQYIEANLYDAAGVQQSELPDGAKGITLRVKGFDGIPELKDGATRKYYIISMHYKGEGEEPEILLTEATYDEETGEVVLPNLTKFSNFFIAYTDTPAPTPVEEETAPASPESGFLTKKALGRAATGTTSLLAIVLSGLSIAAFAGMKFFGKKQ